MPSPEKLAEFVAWCQKHLTGDEKGQSNNIDSGLTVSIPRNGLCLKPFQRHPLEHFDTLSVHRVAVRTGCPRQDRALSKTCMQRLMN